MAKTTLQEWIPSGVKLEATFLINQHMWLDLQSQGWSEEDMENAIKKSITFKDTVVGFLPKVPLIDVFEVEVMKYY